MARRARSWQAVVAAAWRRAPSRAPACSSALGGGWDGTACPPSSIATPADRPIAFGDFPGRCRQRAECVNDCTDAYQQAMATCQQQYASPGQEDQLQDCMDDAQEQLETCTNDCESVD